MIRRILSLFGFSSAEHSAEQLSGEADSPAAETPLPSPLPSPRSTSVNVAEILTVFGQNGETYRVIERSGFGDAETLLLGRGDGSQVTVPRTELSHRDDGSWLLTDAVRDARGLIIPVVEEILDVSRQKVETARVRVTKSVESRDVVVDEPLRRERVVVDHVPINQVIQGEVPQVREQDGVTIIPVIEEQVVTETRLVLVEELHIRRENSEYHNPQTVSLRREQVNVERFDQEGTLAP